MALYLYQGSYTHTALKSLLKKPVNRHDVIRKSVEELGGSLQGAWNALGEYDVVLVIQMPDNVSAAALSLAVAAAGTVHGGKTTPLMTLDEGVASFKKAATSTYQPPSS
jgi:uncharacterized protein with GYD domain